MAFSHLRPSIPGTTKGSSGRDAAFAKVRRGHRPRDVDKAGAVLVLGEHPDVVGDDEREHFLAVVDHECARVEAFALRFRLIAAPNQFVGKHASVTEAKTTLVSGHEGAAR